MGIYKIKPKFQQWLKPIERMLVKNKVHPTTINILALLISILGGIAFYVSDKYPLLLIYIPFMAFIRTALNALDGMVARSLKVKNQQWGEVLNELCDRLSDVAIFLGLAWTSYVNHFLGFTVIIIILLNSYLSILSKAAGGARQYSGFMGKADRMFYLGLMAILILVFNNFSLANITLWFIGLGTVLTLLQRYSATRKELYQ